MSDYISREALKEALENADADVCESYPDGHCDWGFGRKNINDVIDGVPAADVEPVRKNKIGDLKYDAQEREKTIVQLRKKWQAAEMCICTMCGHFDYSIDGNIVYGNKDCGEIVGYPCCKKFTPWIPTSVRLPEELEPVNVVWVNHNPEPYYQEIKDVPQKATAVYYRKRWHWWSCVCEDLLAEYGRNEPDLIDSNIEITHWMPLPEPPEEVFPC